jgi:hypothetical protein
VDTATARIESEGPLLDLCIGRALSALAEIGELEPAVRYGAVHSWYEGHIAGEKTGPLAGHAQLPASAEQFPSPPFPSVKPGSSASRALERIVAEHLVAHQDDAVAAIEAGCRAAWRAGYLRGLNCPGCRSRWGDDEVRERILAGVSIDELAAEITATRDEAEAEGPTNVTELHPAS